VGSAWLRKRGQATRCSALYPTPSPVLAGTSDGVSIARPRHIRCLVPASLEENVICQASLIGMMAVAMTVVLISGNFDLSDASGGELLLRNPVIFLLIFTAIMWISLRFAKIGRRLYAAGGNPEASRLSGINVTKYRLMTFVFCSTTAGFAESLGPDQRSRASAWKLRVGLPKGRPARWTLSARLPGADACCAAFWRCGKPPATRCTKPLIVWVLLRIHPH
jgi:hypothetical protein